MGKDNAFQIRTRIPDVVFANFNMNFNAMFAMTHFLKLCYYVFIQNTRLTHKYSKKLVSICVISQWKLC
jgi:hypothetical protein